MSSNKDKQKVYRERKKAEMGDAAFKASEAAKRKARRNRPATAPATAPAPTPTPAPTERPDNITIPTINNNNNQLLLNVFFEKYKKRNNTATLANFKKNTWNPFLKIYSDIHNEEFDFDSINWAADDPTKIIEWIKNKYSNLNTQRTKITIMSTMLMMIKNQKKPAQIYKKEADKLQKQIEAITHKNLSTPKEKINLLKWAEIKNIWKDDRIHILDRVLMGLYTVIPPRRIEMGQLLTLTNTTKNLNKNLNYLVVDKNSNAKYIFMQKYKTINTYGKVKLVLSNKPDFVKLLQKYTICFDIKIGDPLFPTKKGNYHSNFSKLLLEVFERNTGKKISVDLLRHSFITDFLSKKRTVEQKKQIAKSLGHSTTTLDNYDRVDL